MATLYIAEYNFIGGTSNHTIVAPQVPPIAEQIVAISGASLTCGNAFNANTNFVRVAVDSTCSIAFGTSPTATTSTMRLAANQTEYFSIPPNSNFKIAVISNS